MPSEFDVKDWQEKIKNGQRFQNQFADANKWQRYKQYYRHNFSKAGIIPVNIVFSMLRSMVPQVYFRNPSVTITARKPGLEAELNARIVQQLDNWLLGELMTKLEVKKMIQDSFLMGTSSGFIGYDSMFGFDTTKLDPQTGQYTLTQFDKKGYRTEYNANITPGMPWFLRARPEDVIWPWGCESARNAEWVALRVFRPLDDLKKDPKYEIPKDMQGTMVPRRSGPEGSSTLDVLNENGFETTKERQWVELFQVHDARTGKIYVLTMDNDTFLRNQPDELQIDGLPVETLTFNPDPDYIYGIPDARIIEPQQLELNEIRTQAMKHRRLAIVKFLARKGSIEDDEIQKLTDERVAAVAKVESDTAISDAFMSFTPGVSGILQDLNLAGEVVRGDVRESIGFNRNAQGEFQGKTHISATETNKVFNAMNIRLDERRDMVADLLTNVIRKFNQLIFTYWNTERVSQVVGPDGARWWLKYTGDQINGEYDLKVTPEEGSNLDSGTKFDMAVQAAKSWAEMNQGLIASGQPVPAEIQRILFGQFQSIGLDIDRLLAQSNAASANAQQTLGALGKTQGAPVSPGLLAQAMQK